MEASELINLVLDCSQPNIKLMNLSATENTIKIHENLCQNGNFGEKNVRCEKPGTA